MHHIHWFVNTMTCPRLHNIKEYDNPYRVAGAVRHQVSSCEGSLGALAPALSSLLDDLTALLQTQLPTAAAPLAERWGATLDAQSLSACLQALAAEVLPVSAAAARQPRQEGPAGQGSPGKAYRRERTTRPASEPPTSEENPPPAPAPKPLPAAMVGPPSCAEPGDRAVASTQLLIADDQLEDVEVASSRSKPSYLRYVAIKRRFTVVSWNDVVCDKLH